MQAYKTESREIPDNTADSIAANSTRSESLMTLSSYRDKQRGVRAEILLRQWGRWGRKGLAKTGYPTAPPWQRLIGSFGGEYDDPDAEQVNKLVNRGTGLERAVVVTYYVELFHKVKRKRDLPKATRLMVNASNEFEEISTQRVSAIIEHIRHLVSVELIP